MKFGTKVNSRALSSNLPSVFKNFVTFCLYVALKVEQITNTLLKQSSLLESLKITGKFVGNTMLHLGTQICCHFLKKFSHIWSLCVSKSGTNSKYAVETKPFIRIAQNYRKIRRKDDVTLRNSNLLSPFENFVTFGLHVALKVEQIANTLSKRSGLSEWLKITGNFKGKMMLHH